MVPPLTLPSTMPLPELVSSPLTPELLCATVLPTYTLSLAYISSP
jgi:hypothetical protein